MCDASTAPGPGRVAVRLRAILSRGVVIGRAETAFIEAAFPEVHPTEWGPVLENDAGTEAESALALLFFPDEAVQLEVEELLAGRALTPAQVAELAARLAAPPLTVAFELPEGRGRIELAFTAARARQWVEHLRLTRAVPRELEAAIACALSSPAANRWRLIWRNARLRPAPAVVDFLGRLIPAFDPCERQGRDGLAFLLEFLRETGDDADIHRGLAERKRRLAAALARSRRQEAALTRGTMETLIGRGGRLVAVDKGETRRQMDWIDRACRAAFGRIEAIDFPEDPL